MTHTYNISGMTCESCESKVKSLLEKVPGVTSVKVDRTKSEAQMSMNSHISTPVLQNALKDHPRYQLSENDVKMHQASMLEEEEKPWFQTYKPIFLVFGFITGVTLLIQSGNDQFHWMQWMNHFMAGFFLVFSRFSSSLTCRALPTATPPTISLANAGAVTDTCMHLSSSF